ncbi:MAG: heme lyase CcmF/NrfE family subunit [Proteobacteria bacterium]|nr:heme lyase CcmF/NrfE family subunit [Pseudomonadota bacterium]MCP4917486.1 heme lyase CcmF/NrfE family subunit [Pseudomonadota bacterium]
MLLALAACTIGAVGGIIGGYRKQPVAWQFSRWMAYLFGGAMVAATLLMEFALLSHDFSVGYVAQVGSLDTPWHITIVSLWSSLEGSILFWAFVLGVSTAVFTYAVRNRDPEHGSYAVGVLLAIGVFFCFLVAGVANPFTEVSPAPLDGPGPNALLQNHLLMILHPPALYLGYVTMAVPFAMACSALLAGRLESSWMRSLRRWTLWAWAWLTLGILLGGWWSYEVLGWGGYWAWDPVENASFMPWLTATAFVHSAQVMERRGLFKGWTIALALSTFLLTMLGTFMTRSGVFNSVHSFTQSEVGPIFLGFIAICSLVSLVLLTLRLHLLSPPKEGIPGPISREVGFLLNNLAFCIFTLTVLLGTTFPLIMEATTEERFSVGEPYFNTMTLPVCVVILFLMGVGPALPWGEADVGRVFKRLLGPLVTGGLIGAIFLFFDGFTWATLTFALSGFAGWVTLAELFSPALGRARKKNESLPVAFAKYAAKSRPRIAAYVVHFGVVLCAVGIAASGSYKQTTNVLLKPNVKTEVLGYDLMFTSTEKEPESNRISEVAWVDVYSGDRMLGTLDPRMNAYMSGMDIGAPSVMSRVHEDLYLSLVRVDDSGVSVTVIVEPFVYWVWIGGLVMFGGGLYGFWPRLVRRRETEPKQTPLAAK